MLEEKIQRINELYRKLDSVITSRCYDFATLSLKYFISVIKDGIGL